MDNYSKYSDANLIPLIRNNDTKASQELFERHSDYIISSLKKYYKLPQTKAEDICMETFSKIFKAIDSFDEKRHFRTWAFSIAKNLLIDQYRKENGKKRLSMGDRVDVAKEDDSIIDTTPTKEDIHNILITTGKIVEIISTLPPIYKDVANLRFIREFQYKAISKELNLPLNTVKTRVRRARCIISTKLKQYGLRIDS